MKKFVLLIVVFVALFSSINAQVIINADKAKDVQKALLSGKVTGRISYPKSIGTVTDFEQRIKSAFELKRYNVVNMSPVLAGSITINKITITNVTNAASNRYEYEYVIEAVFPIEGFCIVSLNSICFVCGSGGKRYVDFPSAFPAIFVTNSYKDRLFEDLDFWGVPSEIIPS
jgi:hypothetical protein